MIPNLPPIRRFFRLQIPQVFRPTVSLAMASTIGHVNLEGPARGLSAVACWIRFARWCNTYRISSPHKVEAKPTRESLYDLIIKKESLDREKLLYLEFGVYQGASFKWWLTRLRNPESMFVGFDTFTGLPEHWRATEPKGAFNTDGRLPEIADQRGNFQVGLFQDTLPRFVKENDLSRRLVINLDADLYTSTLFVLTTLAPYLKPKDILLFDEFSCPLDEYRAFEEFVRSFRVKYDVIGVQHGYTRVCIKTA
jgi:O-methyltransferase